MRELGVFGLVVPEEYAGSRRVAAQPCVVGGGDRPWRDERVRVINTRVIVARLLIRYGTRGRRTISCRKWRWVRYAAPFRCPNPGLGSAAAAITAGTGRARPYAQDREGIERMGHSGVDTAELPLEGLRVPAGRVLDGMPGRGFYQMMDGAEIGRVNGAARGRGVTQRTFELAIAPAQQRHTFGKPIARHQAVEFTLAEMRQRSRQPTR